VWLYVNGRKVTAIVEQFFDVRVLWMRLFSFSRLNRSPRLSNIR